MTEDEAVPGLATFPPTYTLRGGIPVCTTCGAAVIGNAGAGQTQHLACEPHRLDCTCQARQACRSVSLK